MHSLNGHDTHATILLTSNHEWSKNKQLNQNTKSGYSLIYRWVAKCELLSVGLAFQEIEWDFNDALINDDLQYS